MSTQVQMRRGTFAQCEAMIPADGEVVIDQTNMRLRLGDGAISGGLPLVNSNDTILLPFNNATVGGSANSITLALTRPISSYTDLQYVRFIATATNSGSVTFNIDGVGSLTGKKVKGGTIQNLAAGDIVNGAVYEGIVNNGTFQITNLLEEGLTLVTQGDLSTSSGSAGLNFGIDTTTNTHITLSTRVGGGDPSGYATGTRCGGIYYHASGSIIGQAGSVTLPGGTYGFYPQTAAATVSTTTNWTISQRYILSSPPYDLGEGAVAGFFFALVDKDGKIHSHYLADTPPWAYNGPTDIMCTHKCRVTGKKFRRAVKKRSFEEIMDGAKLEYEMQEITDELKNKDMYLFPTPFEGYDTSKFTAVLIDPMDVKIKHMVDYQNAGGLEEVVDSIRNGKFNVDNQTVNRKGPKDVPIHKLKYKYNKKF